MVRAACTNIAVRTTVMIGSLVLLLLMALLPGPIGYLVGSQRGGQVEREATAGVVGEAPDMAGSRAEIPAAKGAVLPPEVRSEPLAAAADPAPSGGASTAADTVATATASPPATAAADATPPATAAADAPPVDRCWYITSRLRQWGAAYYRLESWQDDPQVFRFQCTLPANVAGDSGEGQYRTFEAVGPDPAGAMERVLADVRAWRDGGRF